MTPSKMAINRRNVLLGLGAIVGGGGALVGTGAFSTVSAARTVTVNTTGDGSAFLKIGPGPAGSSYLGTTDTSGRLTIDLTGGTTSDGFNQDAITTIDGILTVTNNAADDTAGGTGAITIGVSSNAPSADPSPMTAASVPVDDGNGNAVAEATFYVGNDATVTTGTVSSNSIGKGESVDIGVKIDTQNTGSLTTDPDADTISLVATNNDQ